MGSSSVKIGVVLSAFLFGCLVSTTIVLNCLTLTNTPSRSDAGSPIIHGVDLSREASEFRGKDALTALSEYDATTVTSSTTNPLHGQRILIAIAAFNFAQIPHLSEVLDSYQDLCVTGASKVDIVIHTTVPYPVTLIDLLNSRLLPACQNIFSISIVLKPNSLRLHLVDVHRDLFYKKIDDYDLFIYTEDDIRVPPRVVGSYLAETKNIQDIVGMDRSSDFNVGIVRYEYNFPGNVAVDDKTRGATQNVTRVYWEHGMYPVFPEAMFVAKDPDLKDTHVSMNNCHQGMYMATSFLLKAWKIRENCKFHIASNRPTKKGDSHQPLMGTQRVWMSSKHLYDRRYGCNVKQVLPVKSFGTLTVLHLPNKNYRRVGHFRNRTFSDGTEVFDFGSSSLLSEMRLHIELRNATKQVPTIPYAGIRMVDEVERRRDRSPLLERRMGEYQAYIDRGGILTKEDMGKTALVEER